MDKVNAYTVLGISPKASLEEIRMAYRAKALLFHPDRGGKVEYFLALQKAHEILTDEFRRAKEGLIQQFDRLPLRLQPSLSATTSILFENLNLLGDRLKKSQHR